MGEIERTSPNSARVERTYNASAEDLKSALRRAVDSLDRWEISEESEREIEAIRTTRLLHFKDDIRVEVSDLKEGSKAVFESASRVGKSDLGQNPKNLKELLEAMDRQLN